MTLRADGLKNDPKYITLGDHEVIKEISDRFGLSNLLKTRRNHVKQYGGLADDCVMMLDFVTGKIGSISRQKVLEGPSFLAEFQEQLRIPASEALPNKNDPFWVILLGTESSDIRCVLMAAGSLGKGGEA